MSQRSPVRHLRVSSSLRLTPHMVRVTFTGEDLTSAFLGGPDQQVRLYFPREGQERPRMPEADGDLMSWYQAYTALPEDERPWMRAFTLRGHDPDLGTVDIDFVVHGDDGPATSWARRVRPGAVLGMVGPSPEYSLPFDTATPDNLLLAGDETALPAIGTLLESLPEGRRALVLAEVRDAGEELPLPTRADVDVRWVHRGEAAHGDRLLEAVRAADLPPGRVGAWIAGEAGMVRALRRHLVQDRGVPRKDIDFTGYWRRTLTQDDAPTGEDMADAREKVALHQER
ncbi:NADPH-dependent ferric siderophore reductase [Nocardiopsis sp. CNR-923]|uniref:siderophore-interacting protein n=1 Tax=Nocardiopsis sp. CNR-923 TaxID=1904965 RepID=UPI00095EBDF0|nr:siderophore-interacting protein [Nocardiopsis sp. CNR-923]OLT27561.1 NADPH-dependent ferric siderophore reductase [Nocardiopsis sp. CNR-923]